MSEEKKEQTACQRCLRRGEDLRTISVACGYNMSELSLPFKTSTITEGSNPTHERQHRFFTLSVCKECRADWLATQVNWFHGEPTCLAPSPGTGIYMRSYGGTFEISEKDWQEICAARGEPDRVPVRYTGPPPQVGGAE